MNLLLLTEVAAERRRQDAKWGTAAVEGTVKREVSRFAKLMTAYTLWADTMASMGSYEKCRRRLVQVAAMALACVEFLDREGKTAALTSTYVRFTVDGHEFPDEESNLAGDGEHAPFMVFDCETQDYLIGSFEPFKGYKFMKREQAQAVADALNAAELRTEPSDD